MKNFFKNPKTYLLLIIMAPMVALGVFFFNYYAIYKSAVDPFAGNTNLSNVNVIIKNPFENIDIIEDESQEVLPTMGDDNDSDLDKAIIENDVVDSKNQVSTPPKQTIDNTQTNSNNKPRNTSYNYIVGTYKNEFEKLQKKQENNLYSLMEKGKAEYVASGSKKISALNLATKYLNLVNSMEKQSDKEFNNLINNLKNELTKNSHSTDIVKEISDYYSYYKKSLKSQLFEKAAGHM